MTLTCLNFKGVGIVLAIALLVPAIAKAEDLKRAQQILNNYSHQNVVCTAYYLFVMKCLKGWDPTDKSIDVYEKVSRELLHRSLVAGKASGLSDAAMEARILQEVDEQRTATENSCSNSEVLRARYREMCKALYNDGPDKLEADMKDAEVK